ncbi:phenazine biosynthesis PhzC/PhzF family protein [Galdieria sulphuraria]|uniref:Phenazine biosynthesis PhzC/PhzF family protein n=1 Tax=Galdieria sulphuraria TaxID=130081 RepID=M2X5J0_GALSU|nr:phenazine biosynthesis PhzC/PhzF family protein [Galdieria sulphuraria]EME31755.1 phenazine biosynthesis PhzC/PhzF family protein [Galdieria sulphuraria]|eukprot:XP_005708275.1 phenazine biosynthesis PhzC/PhzF family protein [Galdieria sulphuraria]
MMLGFIVDAFVTERPFSGNPAGVCLIPSDKTLSDDLMQNIANELKHSETAFIQILSSEDGELSCSLRWFTPTVEVELCGHATLASAAALSFSKYWNPATLTTVKFHTLYSGDLIVQALDANFFQMDFPLLPVEQVTESMNEELLAALGLRREQVVYYGKSKFDVFIHVQNQSLVEKLTPAFEKLLRIPQVGRGVIVTSLADNREEAHFCSRFFAPWTGVNEDPVTGSAHCSLGYYWNLQLGKSDLYVG